MLYPLSYEGGERSAPLQQAYLRRRPLLRHRPQQLVAVRGRGRHCETASRMSWAYFLAPTGFTWIPSL